MHGDCLVPFGHYVVCSYACDYVNIYCHASLVEWYLGEAVSLRARGAGAASCPCLERGQTIGWAASGRSCAGIACFTLATNFPERALMPQEMRVEYGIEKPSNKLLAMTDLDSDGWV